jgi:hypothetical protein
MTASLILDACLILTPHKVLRLVVVVGGFYFNLVYAMSAFYLFLIHQRFSSSL